MNEFNLYFQLGWQHILDWEGYDHILFVTALCGIYLLKDWRRVLVLVTAFTLGHSLTLALSVLDQVRVDPAWIEFLIPVTIVITAMTSVVQGLKRPKAWLVYAYALFFGLIHGLGFSNYLRSLLGAEHSITTPLLAFNVGLEFGQLLIVFGALLVSFLAVQLAGARQRDWNLFLSSAIFGISFVMALERLQELI